MQEASAGLAAAQEISLDAAVGAVLSELGCIFTVKVKKTKKTALKAFIGGRYFTPDSLCNTFS